MADNFAIGDWVAWRSVRQDKQGNYGRRGRILYFQGTNLNPVVRQENGRKVFLVLSRLRKIADAKS